MCFLQWIIVYNHGWKTEKSARIDKYGESNHSEVQEKIARLCHAVWNKWEFSKVSKVKFIGKNSQSNILNFYGGDRLNFIV